MHPALATGLRTFVRVEAGLLAAGALLAATGARSLDVGVIGDDPVAPGEAERAAREFLDRVDWSKPTIVVWMPGINASVGIRDEFRAALDGIDDPYWIGALEYPRHADMGANVPIGARALELVLEEVQHRDPDGTRYRVAVGGESLGAWMTSEAMQRPAGRVIDRAAFFGVSGPASSVPSELADRVRSYRDVWDPAAMPYLGAAELWTDAGDLAFGGGSSRIPGAIMHTLLNPFQAIVGAVTTIRMQLGGPEGYKHHPHNYWREMPGAARFLIEE